MSWSARRAPGGEAVAEGSHIAVASRNSESSEVFTITSTGAVQGHFWQVHQEPKRSNALFTPPGKAAIGGISAIARDEHHLEVFFVSPTLHCITGRSWDTVNKWAAHNYTAPNTAVPGCAIKAVSRNAQCIEVFFFGPGGSVEGIFWTGGAWMPHAQIAPPGSADPLGSSLAAVSRNRDSCELWWTTPDGRINGAMAEGPPGVAAFRVYNMDKNFTVALHNNAALTACSRQIDHMAIFWITPAGCVDGAQIHLTVDNPERSWTYFTIDKSGHADTTAGICVTAREKHVLDIVWRYADGRMWTATCHSATASPKAWSVVGSVQNGQPAGTVAPRSRVSCQYRWADYLETYYLSYEQDNELAAFVWGHLWPPTPDPRKTDPKKAVDCSVPNDTSPTPPLQPMGWTSTLQSKQQPPWGSPSDVPNGGRLQSGGYGGTTTSPQPQPQFYGNDTNLWNGIYGQPQAYPPPLPSRGGDQYSPPLSHGGYSPYSIGSQQHSSPPPTYSQSSINSGSTAADHTLGLEQRFENQHHFGSNVAQGDPNNWAQPFGDPQGQQPQPPVVTNANPITAGGPGQMDNVQCGTCRAIIPAYQTFHQCQNVQDQNQQGWGPGPTSTLTAGQPARKGWGQLSQFTVGGSAGNGSW